MLCRKNQIGIAGWIFCILFLSAGIVTAQPYKLIPAPEFSLPDSNGQFVSLSTFKGKVVLVDFWASWCRPCRMANKGLVKIHDQFSSKGLIMISISLDGNKIPWRKAIQKDKLHWIQLIDTQAWKSVVATAWDVHFIPASFLLDQEGNIIADHLEGIDLENAISKLLNK